jgi:hypothetical protein
MLDGEPFGSREARKLIRSILVHGVLYLESPHFKARLRKHRITIVDVSNVLRGGVVEEAELENGRWRYRVRTMRICVVIHFVLANEIFVVTSWRMNQ